LPRCLVRMVRDDREDAEGVDQAYRIKAAPAAGGQGGRADGRRGGAGEEDATEALSPGDHCSELPAEADARQERDAAPIGPRRVVEVVRDGLDVAVVVDVLDVEVPRELPALELPALVEADVELVEEREPLGRITAERDRDVDARGRGV